MTLKEAPSFLVIAAATLVVGMPLVILAWRFSRLAGMVASLYLAVSLVFLAVLSTAHGPAIRRD